MDIMQQSPCLVINEGPDGEGGGGLVFTIH